MTSISNFRLVSKTVSMATEADFPELFAFFRKIGLSSVTLSFLPSENAPWTLVKPREDQSLNTELQEQKVQEITETSAESETESDEPEEEPQEGAGPMEIETWELEVLEEEN